MRQRSGGGDDVAGRMTGQAVPGESPAAAGGVTSSRRPFGNALADALARLLQRAIALGDAFARGRALKPLVFVSSLLPLAWLVYLLFTGGLGANPIESLTDRTGELGLRLLLLSLMVTPLRFAIHRTWPLKLRRMLGLFAFFYVVLHVAVWSLLDQRLNLYDMWADLMERPYILAGFIGFAILLPLAATSTRRIARRMKMRWFALHRLVYIGAAAAVVHFVWLTRGDQIEPFVYLAILVGLYLIRFARMLKTA